MSMAASNEVIIPRSAEDIIPRSAEDIIPRSAEDIIPRSAEDIMPRSAEDIIPRSAEDIMPRSAEDIIPRSAEDIIPRSAEDIIPRSAEDIIPRSAEDITPSWVQQVLQRDFPGIIITDVDVKGSISSTVEGLNSDIIALDATGTRDGSSRSYSFAVKLTDFARMAVAVEDLPGRFRIKNKKTQIKSEASEVKFYSVLVPKLLSVHGQTNKDTMIKSKSKDGEGHPPADYFPFPKCYFAATDPTSKMSVRVMENLKAQGFSIIANRQSLSLEEMMLTVEAVAQLHGMSHRLELQWGTPLSEKFGEILAETVLEESVEKMQYRMGLNRFAAAFPDEDDLLDCLGKIDFQNVLSSYLNNSPRIKVLNHGDWWINNIMIKYEEEVPAEVKLVDWDDFQYLPPTCDLAFLFLCSAGWKNFHNHRDDILAHYHQELMKTLGPNGSQRLQSYTLEELKADFKADCLYGVIQRIITLIWIEQPDTDFPKMVQEIKNWGVI